MIYLQSVTKVHFSTDAPPRPIFGPTTLVLPTDRRVAILGDRMQGKTTFLRLITGAELPDQGRVAAPPLHFSPIFNPSKIFQSRLSGLENLRLVGRMLGVSGDWLALAVSKFCDGTIDMDKPWRAFKGTERQTFEVALLSVLSFDCYILDNAHLVPTEMLERCFNATAGRGAGMIFTTTVSRLVDKYADYAIVIRNHTARAFHQVEEAIESYERKAG